MALPTKSMERSSLGMVVNADDLGGEARNDTTQKGSQGKQQTECWRVEQEGASPSEIKTRIGISRPTLAKSSTAGVGGRWSAVGGGAKLKVGCGNGKAGDGESQPRRCSLAAVLLS